jgi:predicted transcriptional regulator
MSNLGKTRKNVFKTSEERRQSVLNELMKTDGLSIEEISERIEVNINATTLLLRTMVRLEEVTFEIDSNLKRYSASVLVTRSAESLMLERQIKDAATKAKKAEESAVEKQIFRIEGLPTIVHRCSDKEPPKSNYKERPRRNIYAKGSSSILGGSLIN